MSWLFECTQCFSRTVYKLTRGYCYSPIFRSCNHVHRPHCYIFCGYTILQNVLAAESGIIINISDNETKADITVDDYITTLEIII